MKNLLDRVTRNLTHPEILKQAMLSAAEIVLHRVYNENLDSSIPGQQSIQSRKKSKKSSSSSSGSGSHFEFSYTQQDVSDMLSDIGMASDVTDWSTVDNMITV